MARMHRPYQPGTRHSSQPDSEDEHALPFEHFADPLDALPAGYFDAEPTLPHFMRHTSE